MRNLKKLIGLTVLGAMFMTAVGCHTTEGFGEDMERGGRKIKNEAREHE